MGPPVALPIRRNTLLSAALATNSAMLQLSAAVASLTLVNVLGVEGLLGLGPAIVLGSGAIAALPAGRAMDRVGRVPVLAGGFLVGALGCVLAAIGSAASLGPLVLAGLVGVERPAASRCWRAPPRATCTRPTGGRGASRSCCSEPCSGRSWAPRCSARFSPGASWTAMLWRRSGWRRAPSWSWAAGWSPACVPIPAASPSSSNTRSRFSARALLPGEGSAAPLKELLGRRGVIPALIAAQASFAVMVGVMTLTGAVVVDHQGHEGHDVFLIIGAT